MASREKLINGMDWFLHSALPEHSKHLQLSFIQISFSICRCVLSSTHTNHTPIYVSEINLVLLSCPKTFGMQAGVARDQTTKHVIGKTADITSLTLLADAKASNRILYSIYSTGAKGSSECASRTLCKSQEGT